jgi:ABC-2 type transport system ATP-binding protein
MEEVVRVFKTRRLFRESETTVALDKLSLTVPRGVVFGLLGPNGAGKTTAVRILSTLLTPTKGRASVMGYDVEREARKVRPHIGLILGGERGLYWRLTARENLQYFAALNRMSPREADRRSKALLEQVGLRDQAERRIEQLSRGMKQRLHIARGLLTDPEVLFMDEPTIGLDPFGAQEVRQLIPALVARGKTVLLTTHYMFEADTLCNTIALINKGKLVAMGTPAEIKQKFSKVRIVEVTVRQARATLMEELSKLDGVQRVDAGADGALAKFTVYAPVDGDMREAVARVVGKENVEGMVARDPTLEEAYLSILR